MIEREKNGESNEIFRLLSSKNQNGVHPHLSFPNSSRTSSRGSSSDMGRREKEETGTGAGTGTETEIGRGMDGYGNGNGNGKSQIVKNNYLQVLHEKEMNLKNAYDTTDNTINTDTNDNMKIKNAESSNNINVRNIKLSIIENNINNNNNDSENINVIKNDSKNLNHGSTSTINTYLTTVTNVSYTTRDRSLSVISTPSSYTASPHSTYSKEARTIFGNNYNHAFQGNSGGLHTPSHQLTGRNCFNYDPRYNSYNNYISKFNMYNDNINNNNNIIINNNDNNNNNNNNNINVVNINNNNNNNNSNNSSSNKIEAYPSPCTSVTKVFIHGIFSQGTEYSFFLPPQEQNKYLGKRVSAYVLAIPSNSIVTDFAYLYLR